MPRDGVPRGQLVAQRALQIWRMRASSPCSSSSSTIDSGREQRATQTAVRRSSSAASFSDTDGFEMSTIAATASRIVCAAGIEPVRLISLHTSGWCFSRWARCPEVPEPD